VASTRRRGKHAERARTALVRLGVLAPRAAVMVTALSEIVWAEVTERQSKVLHATANINGYKSALVTVLEQTATLSTTVLKSINETVYPEGTDNKIQGILLLGVLFGSSTLWQAALERLRALDIVPKTKANKVFQYLPLIEVLLGKIGLCRDDHRIMVDRTSTDLAGVQSILITARKTFDRQVPKKRAATMAKQLTSMVSAADLLDELNAWTPELLAEMDKLARYKSLDVRLAMITRSFLARLMATIAYSCPATRPGPWIAVSIEACETALRDPERMLVFEKHKTSASHGTQVVQLSATSEKLLRRYLEIVRPALGNSDNVFVNTLGRPFQVIDVKLAMSSAPQLFNARIRAAWAAEPDQFAATAWRKLYTDSSMSDSARDNLAKFQCHSRSTHEAFYARNQVTLEKRKIAKQVSESAGIKTSVDTAVPTAVVETVETTPSPHREKRSRFNWNAVERQLRRKDKTSVYDFLMSIEGNNRAKALVLAEKTGADIDGTMVYNKLKNDLKKRKREEEDNSD
jgi:hypothetical protein